MFLEAKPIFPIGKTEEMNTLAAFRTTLDDMKGSSILLTASTFYQLWVNGKFVAFGPARTAKGYARVDVFSLDEYAKYGENEIVILVMGYAIRTLSTVYQKSFLQAEIRRGDEILRASGRDFEGYLPPQRIREVHKYSKQRHFSEVWSFEDGSVLCSPKYKTELEAVAPVPTPIERRAPYAYCEDVMFGKTASSGKLEYNAELPYCSIPYKPDFKGCLFNDDKVDYDPYEWIQRQEQIKTQGECALPVTLGENEYAIFDFAHVEVGFIKLGAKILSDADIVIGFADYSDKDKFKYIKTGMYNAVEIFAKGGEALDFTSFEPYGGKCFIVATKKGEIELQSFGIKTFIHSPSGVILNSPENPELNKIQDAAIRTFIQNSVDIYMDCPSRERAGWLCDSYFMGKAEYAIFGNTEVEDAFLENYRLFKNEGDFPEGILPMCFPSDRMDGGTYIPQWNMWYILEAEEYINERGHKADAELFKPSIDALLKFFAKYENSDGLLEDVPSWNFVEWSAANTWTKNVNYPTNFLYAGTLEACYRIYGDEALLKKADAVRSKAIEQSFDGARFYDHSVRGEDGSLVLQKDCSEIAQYYAILFGGFDIEDKKYESLKTLVTVDCVRNNPDFPADLEPLNSFIGLPLRLESLLKIKAYDIALNEVCAYYGPMAEKTGTLWEMLEFKASLNHGFGSYALVAINRALNKN